MKSSINLGQSQFALFYLKRPSSDRRKRWSGLLDIGDAAVAAQPDYFVTGDRHFIENPEIAKEAGLQIVTPAQFIEAWQGR